MPNKLNKLRKLNKLPPHPIRFRAFDTSQAKMLTVHTHLGSADDARGELDWERMWEWDEIYIPMQDTGLQDKHGAAIFEGDIIRFTSPRKSGFTKKKHRKYVDMVIEWHAPKARFVARFITPTNDSVERTYGHLLSVANDPNHEIIGNIYENPELLNQ